MLLRLFSATVFLILILTSCKKYPEGGKHFYAAHRLIKNWTITKFEIDNIDSLRILDQRFVRNGAIRIINKYFAHQPPGVVNPYLKISDSIVSNVNCGVSFYNSSEELKFGNNYARVDKNVYPFWINRSEWQILELTGSKIELKLADPRDGKSYHLVLE